MAERAGSAGQLHHLHRLLGIDVVVAHEPARLVGADRYEGQRQLAGDDRARGGRCRRRRSRCRRCSRSCARRSSSTKLAHRACMRSPVPRADQCTVGSACTTRPSPRSTRSSQSTACCRQARHLARQDGIVAERRDDARPVALPQLRDGAGVHVVVVVVRDEHGIDTRQIFEGYPRRIGPSRADEGHRPHLIRPHRIDQQIASARLDQERRVPDVGDARALAVMVCRRTIAEWTGIALGPRRCPRSVNCHFRNAPRPFPFARRPD